MGARLAATACADRPGVDIVVANEPGGVRASAELGCTTLVLAGSDEDGPVTFATPASSTVPGYLVGSAGGATANALTVGALQVDAHEVVIEFAKDTGRPLRFQHIRFGTDASVKIDAPTWFASDGNASEHAAQTVAPTDRDPIVVRPTKFHCRRCDGPIAQLVRPDRPRTTAHRIRNRGLTRCERIRVPPEHNLHCRVVKLGNPFA
jgi:hypothetical protein